MAGPFAWHPEQTETGPRMVLEGDITEDADLDGLRRALGEENTLDAGAVRRINSCGVRDWITFVDEAKAEGKAIAIHRCAVPLVSQLNMITNFRGHCTISSVMAPYVCPACDEELTLEVPLDGNERERIKTAPACPECAAEMEFDDLEEQYFAFLDRP